MIKKVTYFFSIILLLMLSTLTCAKEKEPALTIDEKGLQHVFLRSDLLSRKGVSQVTINNNRAYPHLKMTYAAVRLCDLLKSYAIKSMDFLEFIALDHFSVLIPAHKIMNCHRDASIAYLAIEPEKKWPFLKNNTGTTAGPFDVIWLHPEKSYISDEYWAWSVVQIKVHEKLDPTLFPSPPIVDDKATRDRLKKGHDLYVSHCAACHSMNHIGKGVIGPDLNIPKNPVEYYPDDKVLKQFIRDPQSVRVIKNDRMSGSSEQFLSNQDLDHLIFYFHYMAKHKEDARAHLSND